MRDRADPEVDLVIGDVAEPETWTRALAGIDAVFHLAAAVGATPMPSVPAVFANPRSCSTR
jgi:uncharacterized protein YbjT (DUF2867 family)